MTAVMPHPPTYVAVCDRCSGLYRTPHWNLVALMLCPDCNPKPKS